MKFEEISYDIIGNKKDGFEVNAKYNTGNFIELSERAFSNDRILIEELKEQGVLKKGLHLSSIGIEGYENEIYISDNRNGRPEFELKKVKEKK